jgi:hypothetical protein
MVMVQCTGEGGADEESGAGSSSSIGTSSSSGCLPASQSTVMAAIFFFWSVVSSSQSALEREKVMVEVVRRGERDWRRVTMAMAGEAVYIVMVGDRDGRVAPD